MEHSSLHQDPIEIRGHTLLCLQGFRGEGYDRRFIDNMTRIHTFLQENPERKIKLIDSPDAFCKNCPNLRDGCALRGPGFEKLIVNQDREVLRLLGLEAGQMISWAEVLSKIGSRMRSEMLDSICGDCQWLPLGYCKEGIDRLRHRQNLNSRTTLYPK